ncbi:MAG: dephospho-CoA kinase [Myxococcales bacterium]|jgi:dephospho-CoA kinase|nr:dephospho-CoA kinase [Myxococcales bacterium]
MRRIGLTGGIASGKSSVARWIEAKGAPIIDADRLARDVTRPETSALRSIATRWPQVIRADGTLDRGWLGRVIFSDPTERAALEAIVLPEILDAFERWAREREAEGCPLAVFDAALLFEQDLDARFDGILLVAAPPELQIERIVARDGLSPDEANARVAAQLPLELKRPRAHWILENTGSIEALRDQFEALWARVIGPSLVLKL